MACHCDVIVVVIRIQYGDVVDGSSDGDSDYGTVAWLQKFHCGG